MKAPKAPGTQDFFNFDNSSDTTPPFGTPPNPMKLAQQQESNEMDSGNPFEEGNPFQKENLQNADYSGDNQDEFNEEGYAEGYDEQYPPRAGLMLFGLKATGILLVIFMMFMAWKFVNTRQIAEDRRIENIVKLNPSGGYYDGTKETNNEVEYINSDTVVSDISGSVDWALGTDSTSNDVQNSSNYKIITEIMKYQKSLSNDGRPYLTLQSDKYGIFDIYIPYQQYGKLDNTGFILTDIELVNNKVQFLYISSKQENLENLINK